MSKEAREARARLVARGIAVTTWAKQNGVPIRAVRVVLSGHNKGRWGQSHKIAVALGMKAPNA
jgi:gp16 family phage-associated protein